MTWYEWRPAETTRPKPADFLERRDRWATTPRCGAWMPRMQEPCGRTAGHADGHRTAYHLECRRMAARRSA